MPVPITLQEARITVNASDTLYAEWTTLPTYTISYDENQATSGSVPAPQTKIQGVSLSLRTNTGNLARSGYSFTGWNTSSSGTGIHYAAGGTYSVNASDILYAEWTPLPTYEISYNENEATSGSVPESQTKTHDDPLTLQTNTGNLARTGYTFSGWNASSSGGGTHYDAGGTYSVNAADILYAEWTPLPTYVLSVDSLGASGVAITSSTSPDYEGTTNYSMNSILQDTTISLTAPANAWGIIFSSWSGCDTVTGFDCTVSMTMNRAVTVNYAGHIGDIDGSGSVDLSDAIESLKLMVNMPTTYVQREAEINGDGKVGIAEAIFALQYLARSSYETVTSAGGRIWMDRNLGAYRVATSSFDSEAFGDLYQWGRDTDGHEVRTSRKTSIKSTSDDPGHDKFILDNDNTSFDWRTPQNNDLWQAENGLNNPCPSGFRLPTKAEWETEIASWDTADKSGAINSPLKLPAAGLRQRSDGNVIYEGSYCYYWSGTVEGLGANSLNIYETGANIHELGRSFGSSVRCIQD